MANPRWRACASSRRPRGQQEPAHGYLDRWGDFIVGLAYLWEGQILLTVNLLRPTLAQAEADLGRRSPFTCMLASLLAAALWESNEPDEAAGLLANRLDVLERVRPARHGVAGLSHRGAHRGRRRGRAPRPRTARTRSTPSAWRAGWPRLRVASLVDQVRLHARRFRAETCRDLCARIDAFLADPATPTGPLWRRSVAVLRDVALGHAAIAAQEWRRAAETLAQADSRAQEMHQGRLHLELLGLRAYALDRCGEKSLPLLHEAVDLAATYGLVRVFDDAHPALGDWVRQNVPGGWRRRGRRGPARWQRRCGRRQAGPGPRRAPTRRWR